MKQILSNFFVLFLLLGVVYLITLYSSPVRESLHKTKSAVAGISTSDLPKASLPEDLSKDAKEQIEKVKGQALDVKVGEVFEFLGRSGKVVEDIKLLQERITSTLEGEKKNEEN